MESLVKVARQFMVDAVLKGHLRITRIEIDPFARHKHVF